MAGAGGRGEGRERTGGGHAGRFKRIIILPLGPRAAPLAKPRAGAKFQRARPLLRPARREHGKAAQRRWRRPFFGSIPARPEEAETPRCASSPPCSPSPSPWLPGAASTAIPTGRAAPDFSTVRRACRPALPVQPEAGPAQRAPSCLYFYPRAFTEGCTLEAARLLRSRRRFPAGRGAGDRHVGGRL